ncbi:SsgA family sporulation/cell division regulator [Streptomyces sp. HNM0574]|uniref:SsgA family sporulation/cell division regulator n=1 Tax=Streptomyces sp. HNM0574 TaxID=2714954 RepID=UPI00146E2067|nr:SsgA family sporulation/cell division regulator [Streptomyces sp. HNM0574]NLU70013.1 SsgA family sporulation/cell division regulator [Streptomyces sp. HNM0574]
MSAVIDHTVSAQLLAERPRTLSTVLRFTTCDPLAVQLRFAADASLDGTEVVWTFGRELLEAGTHAPSGEGDVHIRPDAPGRTVIELHSPQGVAVLEFPTAALRHFLTRSYAAAPDGQGHPELDSALTALLRGV